MSVRSTSVESYNLIKENGLLSKKRWDVYSALYNYGPKTGMELLTLMSRSGVIGSRVDSQVRARLNELREMGVARELRTRVCSITGMEVIEWDVTDRLPKPYKREKKNST